jgi:hypothetical protein
MPYFVSFENQRPNRNWFICLGHDVVARLRYPGVHVVVSFGINLRYHPRLRVVRPRRVQRLIAKHGADVKLPDLKAILADCPKARACFRSVAEVRALLRLGIRA